MTYVDGFKSIVKYAEWVAPGYGKVIASILICIAFWFPGIAAFLKIFPQENYQHYPRSVIWMLGVCVSIFFYILVCSWWVGRVRVGLDSKIKSAVSSYQILLIVLSFVIAITMDLLIATYVWLVVGLAAFVVLFVTGYGIWTFYQIKMIKASLPGREATSNNASNQAANNEVPDLSSETGAIPLPDRIADPVSNTYGAESPIDLTHDCGHAQESRPRSQCLGHVNPEVTANCSTLTASAAIVNGATATPASERTHTPDPPSPAILSNSLRGETH